jgi:MoxR-like ATPase
VMSQKAAKQQTKTDVGQVSAITINKLQQLIEETYFAVLETGEEMPSILLIGRPGVGKTVGLMELAKRIAERMGREFVNLKKEWWRYDEVLKEPSKYFAFLDFSVTHVEPTDLSGFPREKNGGEYVAYLPLEYVRLFSHPDCAGVLFLDEITLDNRVDRQSSEYKILDEKQFGFRTLSEKVLLVTAGNSDKDNAIAQPIPDAILRGRVMRFYIRPPTVDEWINYMDVRYGEKWDRRVAVFLKRWPDVIWVAYQDDAGYDPRASPRNWSKLAVLLYAAGDGFSKEDIELLAASLISGNELELFKTFISTEVPSLDDLRVNVNLWRQLSLEAKYLITSMLSQKTVDELSEKYVDIPYVMAEADREFVELLKNLLPRDKRTQFTTRMARRHPKIFSALADARHKSVDFGFEG